VAREPPALPPSAAYSCPDDPRGRSAGRAAEHWVSPAERPTPSGSVIVGARPVPFRSFLVVPWPSVNGNSYRHGRQRIWHPPPQDEGRLHLSVFGTWVGGEEDREMPGDEPPSLLRRSCLSRRDLRGPVLPRSESGVRRS
jgi:hypothetical protein